MKGHIYSIYNISSNEYYIGSTVVKSLQQRFKKHLYDSKLERNKNNKFYTQLRTSPEMFKIKLIKIVEVNNLKELRKIEDTYINLEDEKNDYI